MRLVPGFCVLLALALVGSASARTPSPCRLLTNKEVAKIFGVKVEERTPDRLDSSCTWKGVSLGGFIPSKPQLTISVTTKRITKAQFVKAYSVEIRAGPTQGTMERDPAPPVHGVGQVAFAGLDGQWLSVWDRGVVLTVDTSLVNPPLATAKNVAKTVLARLAH